MLCDRLKQLRKDAGITQGELAQEIGVAHSTIGRWESGLRKPDTDTLRSLAFYFHVTTDYLLCLTDEEIYVHEWIGDDGKTYRTAGHAKESPAQDEREVIEGIMQRHDGEEITLDDLAKIKGFPDYVKALIQSELDKRAKDSQ